MSDFDFEDWLRHRKRMIPLVRLLHRLPDWTIIALYTLTQPFMHSTSNPGRCRFATLCEEHSIRISKES